MAARFIEQVLVPHHLVIFQQHFIKIFTCFFDKTCEIRHVGRIFTLFLVYLARRDTKDEHEEPIGSSPNPGLASFPPSPPAQLLSLVHFLFK